MKKGTLVSRIKTHHFTFHNRFCKKASRLCRNTNWSERYDIRSRTGIPRAKRYSRPASQTWKGHPCSLWETHFQALDSLRSFLPAVNDFTAPFAHSITAKVLSAVTVVGVAGAGHGRDWNKAKTQAYILNVQQHLCKKEKVNVRHFQTRRYKHI